MCAKMSAFLWAFMAFFSGKKVLVGTLVIKGFGLAFLEMTPTHLTLKLPSFQVSFWKKEDICRWVATVYTKRQNIRESDIEIRRAHG